MSEKASDILSGIYSELSPESGLAGNKFHRLARAVEEISKIESSPFELSRSSDRMRARARSASSYYHFSEFSMLSAHLKWLTATSLREGERDFFLDQRLTLEEDGYIQSPTKLKDHDKWLSFWLPEHEKQTFLNNQDSLYSRSELFDRLDREYFLPKLAAKVTSLWPKEGPAILGQSLDPKVLLRTRFMKFAHKQLLQNVMCHAHGSIPHNSNFNALTLRDFQQLGKDYLFSSIAYLDIHLIRPSESDAEKSICELEAIHPRLGDIYRSKWTKLISSKSKILVFSYCDIGPGIERHFIQFGASQPFSENGITTKTIIDGRLTGRSTFGSGQGLRDVRNLAEEPEAKLVFETSNSLYYCDPKNQIEEISANSRVPRGTSVSVVVEI